MSQAEAPDDKPNKDESENDREQELGGRMSFLEHIGELRDRVRNSVISVIIGFAICYGFSDYILAALLKPVERAIITFATDNPNMPVPQLQSIDVTGAFWAHFSVALWASIFLSSPFIFYQLWKFIAPGLYKNERKWGILFAIVSAICFIGGATFCYFVVLEPVVTFLIGFSTENVPIVVNPDALRLVKFCRKILIGFGLCFELPLIISVLALGGMVTHRGLWRFNRWWIVISAIISAILTPPDIFSQIVMAGPLIVLYNISILLAYLITKRKEKKQREIEASYADDE